MIEAEARKQRPLTAVERELKQVDKKLRDKREALRRARLSLIGIFPGDIRALRQAKMQRLAAEVDDLTTKQKALRSERPAARRADAIKRELGITDSIKPKTKRKAKS